ncbi:MAG: 50S ribosomal protein L17 [Bacteroidetes bacterium]|nr:50S ribosomal protein L17 [Bacteroidota bacterium]
MRHLKAGRKLKRTASHRKATLSALSASLLIHKKIRTTVAKAKETRVFAETLITRAKRSIASEIDGAPKDVAARRQVFSVLRNRAAVDELFNEIAPKVLNRNGGYTRVVKLGRRFGDSAELAILELVDFNVSTGSKPKKKTIPTPKEVQGATPQEPTHSVPQEQKKMDSSVTTEKTSEENSQPTKDSE